MGVRMMQQCHPRGNRCRRASSRLQCHPAPLGSRGTASTANGAERRANVEESAQSSNARAMNSIRPPRQTAPFAESPSKNIWPSAQEAMESKRWRSEWRSSERRAPRNGMSIGWPSTGTRTVGENPENGQAPPTGGTSPWRERSGRRSVAHTPITKSPVGDEPHGTKSTGGNHREIAAGLPHL